jgi:hypothetical protein
MFKKKYPHCDSNAGFCLRRAALYPLSYGGASELDFTTVGGEEADISIGNLG